MKILFIFLISTLFSTSFVNAQEEIITSDQKDGKFGFVPFDSKKVVIPYKYDEVLPKYYNAHCVRIKKKYGLVNTVIGKEVAQVKYDQAFSFIDTNVAVVSSAKKYQLINNSGKIVRSYTFNKFMAPKNSNVEKYFYLVRKGSKYGLLNRKNFIEIPCKYDQVEVIEEKIFVSMSKKKGVLNLEGKPIVPVLFEKVEANGGNYLVCKTGNWGVYDPTNKKFLSPCRFKTSQEALDYSFKKK